jgi:hypothetical protein
MRIGLGALLGVALLMVTACAGTKQTSSTNTIRAPRPPANYVHLASGNLRDSDNIEIGINFEALSEGDSHVQVTFGIIFAGSMQDGAPPAPSHSGSGSQVDGPIIFPDVDGKTEIDAAGDFMAENYPDRTDIVGHIFRSPQKRYLMLVEFQTGEGANALYFDVSRWVAATEALYGN